MFVALRLLGFYCLGNDLFTVVIALGLIIVLSLLSVVLLTLAGL